MDMQVLDLVLRYKLGVANVLRDWTVVKHNDTFASFCAFVILPFLVLLAVRRVWQLVGGERTPSVHEIETRQSWADRFQAIDAELKSALSDSGAKSESAPVISAPVAATPVAAARKSGSGRKAANQQPESAPAPISVPEAAVSVSGKKTRSGAGSRRAATPARESAATPRATRSSSARKNPESENKAAETAAKAAVLSPEIESVRPTRSSLAANAAKAGKKKREKELAALLENQASLFVAAPSPHPSPRRMSTRVRK